MADGRGGVLGNQKLYAISVDVHETTFDQARNQLFAGSCASGLLKALISLLFMVSTIALSTEG